jgi:VWFA-related protein
VPFCVVLATGLALIASESAARQDQRPIFRSGVDVTRIKVAVLDDDGAPIPGLGIDDFHVFEDGEELDLDVVLAPADVPLDVALVIDFSASVDAEWPDPQPREAAERFLDSLTDRDCVYLLPFHDRVGPGVWGEPDDRVIRDTVNQYSYGWSTRLYDALRTAHAALDARAPDYSVVEVPTSSGSLCGAALGPDEVNQRRAAIVILSDGEDTGSNVEYADVLLASHEASRPVFSVAVGMAGGRPRRSRYLSLQAYTAEASYGESLQDQLAEISRVSGGEIVTQRDIRDGYDEVLALLRGYYVLGYRTPQPLTEGWHGIRVDVDGDHRTVTQPGVYRTTTDYAAVRGAMRTATQLQGDDPEAALRMLDVAAQLAPELAVPEYGRGVLLERLNRLGPAREAYERALWLSPGTPAVRLRLAQVAFRLNDHRAAWTHALRAQRTGVNARAILAELDRTGSEPPNREEIRRGPRVLLPKPLAPDLEAQLTLRPIRRAIGQELETDPTFTVVPLASRMDFVLQMDLRKLGARAPRELDLRLELYDVDDGKKKEFRIEVDDVDDAAALTLAHDTAMTAVHDWIIERMERRR